MVPAARSSWFERMPRGAEGNVAKVTDFKQEVADLPRVFRATLDHGHREYDTVVRHTRWGEIPIYILGDGASYYAGLTGTYAFELLLGWPVVLRSPRMLTTYGHSIVGPRAIVLAISGFGESDEMLEAARLVRRRGAVLLVLTTETEGALARMAEAVFPVEATRPAGTRLTQAVCLQAAAGFLALIAARALTRPSPLLPTLEKEWQELPRNAEWVLQHLDDAARSLASELKAVDHLHLVSGGFYYPTACQWARHLRQLGGLRVTAHDLEDFDSWPLSSEQDALILLSGSRSRLKAQLHRLLARAAQTRAKILSVTDRDDRNLIGRSLISVLLPALSEMVASILMLVLLEAVAYHAGGGKSRSIGLAGRQQ